MSSTHTRLAAFIWSVADLLRGDYKQSEYGKVILPFTVLRRLDCVLAPTKDAVLERKAKLAQQGVQNLDMLKRATGGLSFYNTSKLDFRASVRDQDNVATNLKSYVGAFSENAREIFEAYDFTAQLGRLDGAGLTYQVASKFAEIDLSPDVVDNHQMGYAFEELIRKFSEISNETAGEHFTPREVINLMVELLLAPDGEDLTTPGVVRTVLDPACGTGGMLTAAEEFVLKRNPDATVVPHGQELNAESYAICKSDMMIKGENSSNIKHGNSFSHDKHYGKSFDYLLANPPFGVEWKKVKDDVETESKLGFAGRFGAGLPRINDGSLLFLQHMIHHMKKPEQGGSRLAIVFNGSPLFTGAAESGESKIRQWILENDWLEAIVALPDQLFYNTGISTYFWILTNRKDEAHRGKVILLDAREHWSKMRKSLGDKRKYIPNEEIGKLSTLYGEALTAAEDPEHPMHEKVKVFAPRDFGYRRITVERPLKLRFEVTEEALAELEIAKTLAKYEGREKLIESLRGLVAEPAAFRKVDFAKVLRETLAPLGKLPAGVDKAVWGAVSLSDPEGELQVDRKGDPLPDPDLRDNENVPLDEDIDKYMAREVLPHVPDAWVDHTKTKVGYEIPFTRHFYKYVPPRPLEEIDAELKDLEARIQRLLSEVTE
ncbi:Type I restriction-modification system, DNA-methyltransferase subunit M [Actinokineospora spheciospongiae]|uniref:site-specific DNA-methyltransferase (adenine-specific) n=1 Tax=Actinokineospora spheciospongiae TaxID=909613 RepID=W7JDX4_9PSEU|nr:class I SAM-dependent DNA methyltransferase [Actinokineospora spheciospongiae]EWC64184.1 Type I restriction-modification system, DNA-methyltransferase subunit M [Actinokineospora spheciospongiae]